MTPVTILGIDPGLQRTGFGVIRQSGNTLSFVACGTIKSDSADDLSLRLCSLAQGVNEVVALHAPTEAALEETFVSVNGASTLKLGQARGALLLTLAQAKLPVAHYAATLVKKASWGRGGRRKPKWRRWCRYCCRAAANTAPTRWTRLPLPSPMRITGSWRLAVKLSPPIVDA